MSPSPDYLASHEARCTEIIEELRLQPDQATEYRKAYMTAARAAYGQQGELPAASTANPLQDLQTDQPIDHKSSRE